MIRLAVLTSEGKPILPAALTSATELRQVVEQARNLIRECDRVLSQMTPKNDAAKTGQVPYTS
jgi:hypothetical protein